MKGLLPLFLGIFGTFSFSWLGLTVVPNLQIGSLNPQTDEDGGDVYPAPLSGMVTRGAQVYAANGCVYCHSQQVRPDYGGADLDRKWGERRSAPRDYIFEPIVLLGKKRTGPDLANVGHRPAMEEKGAAPAPAAGAAASPAPGASVAPSGAPAAGSPAPLPPAGAQPAPNVASSAPSLVADVQSLTANGRPVPYSAAWHHRHLYNPRSISEDSNMPAFRFLYHKRRISGAASPDALNFAGDLNDNPDSGWEIVPSYDAQCLVAYLMSRDQAHELKEAKSAAIAPAPNKEAKK